MELIWQYHPKSKYKFW